MTSAAKRTQKVSRRPVSGERPVMRDTRVIEPPAGRHESADAFADHFAQQQRAADQQR